MVVRIAGDIKELKAAMAEGRNEIVTTAGQMSKIAESMRAPKIIQDAHAVAAAIKEIGGISSLTEREAAKHARTIDLALEKYKALGKDAPSALRELNDQLQAAGKSQSAWVGQIGKMAGAFGLANIGAQVLTKIGAEFGDMVAKGERLPAIESSFSRLTKSAKLDGAAMLAELKAGTRGMVENIDLMQASNKAILLGLPITEKGMGELATAATRLGRAMGQDATKSVDDLITALGRSSPQILDNLGLTVKVGEANDAYAAKLGKTADALTDGEKKLAFYEAAMAAARRKSAELGEETLTLSEQIGRAWTFVSDKVTASVGAINKAAGAALSGPGLYRGGGMAFGARPSLGQPAAPSSSTAAAVAPEVPPATVVSFKAYTDRIAEARAELGRLTAADRAEIDAGIKLGQKLEELAGKYHLSADAQKLYTDTVKAGAKERSKAETDAERVTMFLQKERIDRANAVRQAEASIWADQAREAQARAQVIAAAFLEQRKAEKAAQAEIDKARADRAKLITQTIQETTKIGDEADALRDARTLSSANAQIRTIQRWAAETKNSYKGTQENAAAFYAAVDKLATEKLAAMSRTWRGFFADLSGVILQAATGGGNPGEAIGTYIGQETGKHFATSLGDKIGKEGEVLKGPISKMFGSTVGGAITSALPGIGALLGPLAGKLTGWVVGLFTGGEGAKANDLRDSLKAKIAEAVKGLEDDAGIRAGLAAFNSAGSRTNVQAAFDSTTAAAKKISDTLARYGLTLDDVGTAEATAAKNAAALEADLRTLSARGFTVAQSTKAAAGQISDMIAAALDGKGKLPESLKPYAQELIRTGGLTDELKRKMQGLPDPVPWEQMKADAEELGIGFDALGSKFKQAELDATASRYAEMFERFKKNGADMAGVTAGAADEIRDLVQQYLKAGLEVPDSLKDIVLELGKQGKLVDENGDKLEEFSKIKFGEKPVAEIDRILGKLDELIEKITGPLTAAFDGMGDGIDGRGTGYDGRPETAHTGGLVSLNGVRRFHRGTGYATNGWGLKRDEFPAILQTGEAVINRDAVQRVGPARIAAINEGRGGAVSVTYAPNVTISAVTNASPAQIRAAVIEGLKHNEAGFRTEIQRRVG